MGTIHAAEAETTATVRVRMIEPATRLVRPIVELTSVESTPFSWSAEIQESGDVAIFHRLPAGAYRLSVRLLGFHEVAADVEVRAATSYEYEALLTVTSQANAEPGLRLVYAEPLGNPQVFDRHVIGTFPAEDVLSSIVETAVAPLIVDRISNGGLRVAEAALVAGQGSSWRHTSIALGRLNVTDPARTGTPLVRMNHAAVEGLMVSTSMLPVSVDGPGPVLTLIPKAPATVWHGAMMLGTFPNRLQSDNALPGAPSVERLAMHRDWSTEFGGPLGARAGLFLSARLVSAGRVERDEAMLLRTSVGSLSANTTVGAGLQGRVHVVGTLDRAAAPYAGRARFQNRDARETDTFMSVQATWERWTSGGTAWSTSSGFVQGVFAPALDGVRSTPGGTVERLRDGPVPALFDVFPGTRRRWTARVDVHPNVAVFGPRHSLAAGARVGHNTAVTSAVTSPAVAELVGGIPARIWEYGYSGPETRWASTELAAYVSDGMTLPGRLRVDVGVRIDMSRGMARDAANAISWLSADPRLNVRWRADTRGRFALFGSYSRYSHPLPLDYFAYGDPAAASGQVHRWNDDNGDRVFQEGERGVLIGAVGPCCAGGVLNQIDPRLERPFTDERLAGVDARFGRWGVRVSALHRRGRHLVASVNTGVQQADYLLRYIPDVGEDFLASIDDRPLPVYDRDPSSFGQDQYLLTNPIGHDTLHQGVEMTIDGSIGSRWRTRFDGTAYDSHAIGANRGFRALENDPGLIGEVFENPNAETYARGHGFFDRGYVAKWWNSYSAPKEYVVSAVVRYQDGQSFGRMVVVPDLNQGPEVIQAYRRGRTRFTFTLTVDAHVQKTFRIGRAKVAGILEVFNLLNFAEEVEEDVLTTPAFRTSTAVQPPRAARIALRLAF